MLEARALSPLRQLLNTIDSNADGARLRRDRELRLYRQGQWENLLQGVRELFSKYLRSPFRQNWWRCWWHQQRYFVPPIPHRPQQRAVLAVRPAHRASRVLASIV